MSYKIDYYKKLVIKMREKIFVFAIISCLLIATPSILGISEEKEISVNEELLLSEEINFKSFNVNNTTLLYNEETMQDYSFTYEKSFLNNDEEQMNSGPQPAGSGNLDLTFGNYNAWYSPFPLPNQNGYKYICFHFTVENIGEEYSGEVGWVNVSAYKVYKDGSEYSFYSTTVFTQHVRDGETSIVRGFSYMSLGLFYDSIKLKVTTTFPDVNLSNNVINIDILEGITVWGKVYMENMFGNNRHLVSLAKMYITSDCDTEDFTYGFGTDQDLSKEHGFFTLVAPKDPNKPLFRNKVTALIGLLRKKSQLTDPLGGMDFREMFITFHKIDGDSTPQSTPSSQQSTTLSSTTNSNLVNILRGENR